MTSSSLCQLLQLDEHVWLSHASSVGEFISSYHCYSHRAGFLQLVLVMEHLCSALGPVMLNFWKQPLQPFIQMLQADACVFKNKDTITGLPARGSRCVPTTAALSPPPEDAWVNPRCSAHGLLTNCLDQMLWVLQLKAYYDLFRSTKLFHSQEIWQYLNSEYTFDSICLPFHWPETKWLSLVCPTKYWLLCQLL